MFNFQLESLALQYFNIFWLLCLAWLWNFIVLYFLLKWTWDFCLQNLTSISYFTKNLGSAWCWRFGLALVQLSSSTLDPSMFLISSVLQRDIWFDILSWDRIICELRWELSATELVQNFSSGVDVLHQKETQADLGMHHAGIGHYRLGQGIGTRWGARQNWDVFHLQGLGQSYNCYTR